MRPAVFAHPTLSEHALLDSGGARRLERFGAFVLDRPDPQALWRPRLGADEWARADLRFERETDRGGRWVPGAAARSRGGPRGPKDGWTVAERGASFLVKPTPFKHVGLFPEQAANWDWVAERVGEPGGSEPPRLLNLFGYTGAASVLAARAGYEVTHVDASKASLAWLRENLAASGMEERAVRIVLDDALAFAQREVRRGSRYRGILLDPPHYGRGPKGQVWRFEEGMAPLLEACAALLAETSFLIVSTYAIGYSPLAFANVLAELEGGAVDAGELALPEEERDALPARLLPCGFCARWWRGLDARSAPSP